MKNLLLILLILTSINTYAQNIGIGTATPDSSAKLDIVSTNSGILIPRMTETQRNNIAFPVEGLLIYQTDGTKGFYYYSDGAWGALKDNKGEFVSENEIVHNTTDMDNDNFVFGSDTLDNKIGTEDNSRFFFNKNKGAFRAGSVDGSEWNDSLVGVVSTAIGKGTIASGYYATALGAYTEATGRYSTALGYRARAQENNATAIGRNVDATGIYSMALGLYSTASGSASTAIGYETVASGDYSTAMGLFSNASGVASVAIGYYTKSPSWGETTIGNYSENYTPYNTIGINVKDRLFTVGNGRSNVIRSNALTILKNGYTGIGNNATNPSHLLHLSSDSLNPLRVEGLTHSATDTLLAIDNLGVVHKMSVNSIVDSFAWKLNGNAGTDTTNFIGTTDNQELNFKVNNNLRMKLTDKGQLEMINGSNSLFIGEEAGENDNLSDNRNTFIGYQNGYNATNGAYNSSIGYQAMYSNTTGNYNMAFGNSALYHSTEGNYNTAIGFRSLYRNLGSRNVGVGYNVAFNNTTGIENTVMGHRAHFSNKTGSNNVIIGHRAAGLDTLSERNVYIGDHAGHGVANGTKTDNVFIGYNAGRKETESHRLYIENSNAEAEDALIYGEFDNDRLRINRRLGIDTLPTNALDIYNSNYAKSIAIDHKHTSQGEAFGVDVNVENNHNVSYNTYGVDAYARKNGATNSNIYGVNGYVADYQTGVNTRFIFGLRGYSYVSSTNGSSYSRGVYGGASGNADSEYAGYFAGDVYTTGAYMPSDMRLKQNIIDYNDALSKLKLLNVKMYNFKYEEYPLLNLPEGEQIGLLSQEVQKIFPNMVKRADETS